MRRRDFAVGMALTATVGVARAQERAKQHRIAIVISAGLADRIHDAGNRFWRAFFAELRRLGDVEGQNLVVEPYSGEGRPEGYADLAREVVTRNPDVIVASTDAIAQAARSANGTIPIVWVGGDPIQAGFAASLARPGGNITGVTVNAGDEIWGKRLQILKETVPSASKFAFLNVRGGAIALDRPQLREACRRLGISLIDLLLLETTPAEFQRVFAQIAQERADAIVVNSNGTLLPYRQLIVELVEKHRLPALYPWREHIEAGGLMVYEVDPGELGRRMADDVHEILNGAKPGDIPIYEPTKYELVVNLKAADALGLTVPPSLLARADEVIE
jgi:putative tryptophan/tyrosine transport system substrate-binding protein